MYVIHLIILLNILGVMIDNKRFILLHYTYTLNICLTFMNWENSDKIEIFSSYFIKT
jgi:hypothetical protein